MAGAAKALEAGTSNAELTGRTSLKYNILWYNNLRSNCAGCLDCLPSRSCDQSASAHRCR